MKRGIHEEDNVELGGKGIDFEDKFGKTVNELHESFYGVEFNKRYSQ
jgi:hypothetical protein